MRNNYNTFWFIIDSVRSFRTGKDDRDWLDIMDEFAKDSVSFTNAITGAPSSKLAAGAMFSGLPSPFIARHFNDWEINSEGISTLKTLVNEYSYNSYSLFDTRNGRENYQNLVPPIKAKLLPKDYRLSDYVWSNKDINYIFNFLFEKEKIVQPCCVTSWYDCRRDPKTSYYVSEAINKIKKNNYYENSIIILMSDHGYPDPDTKLNAEFFRGLGHDMILTDDNIKTPLLIKYPNCPKGIKIDAVVGHIDILPTIFDILNIQYNSVITKYQGKSLLPLINGIEKTGSRIRRTDTRLPMDTKRMVSLRSDQYKYIYVFDDESEFLFDLISDPYERLNLVNNTNYSEVLYEFKQMNKDYEKKIFLFHKNNLLTNAELSFRYFKKKYKTRKVSILLVTKAHKELIDILIDCLETHLNCNIIDLISLNRKEFSSNKLNCTYQINNLSAEEILKLNLKRYSIMLYLTANSKRIFLKSSVKSALKRISAKKSRILDYNFKSYNSFSKLLYIPNIKLFFNWSTKGFFYKEEPIYFMKDLIFFIKRLIQRIFRKERDIDIMAAKEIIEFRNYQLSANKTGLSEMDLETMNHEFDRIKTREE